MNKQNKLHFFSSTVSIIIKDNGTFKTVLCGNGTDRSNIFYHLFFLWNKEAYIKCHLFEFSMCIEELDKSFSKMTVQSSVSLKFIMWTANTLWAWTLINECSRHFRLPQIIMLIKMIIYACETGHRYCALGV